MTGKKRKVPSTAFKKGKPKTGGRKPGVPNKFPREMKEKLMFIAETLESTLLADLKKVSSAKRVETFMETLEYLAPKQARVDSSGNAVTEVALVIKRNHK